MANQGFDLNEISSRANSQVALTMTSDDPLKRESEIRLKEAEAKHLRDKELFLYRLTGAILVIAVLLCVWLIVSKGLANDEGKLALGLLTSIISALLGYITGKSAK
jgi:hypothetical protein